jgi:hypothetical protein
MNWMCPRRAADDCEPLSVKSGVCSLTVSTGGFSMVRCRSECNLFGTRLINDLGHVIDRRFLTITNKSYLIFVLYCHQCRPRSPRYRPRTTTARCRRKQRRKPRARESSSSVLGNRVSVSCLNFAIWLFCSGATCSGKTTLAKHLRDILPDSFIIHQDVCSHGFSRT